MINIILASFQAETVWDRLKNREKKNLFRTVSTQLELENTKKKKIAKKFKNLILASFQSETGQDWQKNREKKNLVPNRLYPIRVRKLKNNRKKFKILKTSS